jgi:hypothetical protein
MVVNFNTRRISRDARKLARTPTLNLKKFIGTDEEDLTKNVKSFKYHGAIININ